jgi:hypothetical protein
MTIEERRKGAAAHARVWYKENPQRGAAARQAYRLKNIKQAKAYSKEYRERNKRRCQEIGQRGQAKKYGLTAVGHLWLTSRPCDICGTIALPRGIDHDHTTGVLRGVLCGSCNRGIGMFKDSSGLLVDAARYLVECR